MKDSYSPTLTSEPRPNRNRPEGVKPKPKTEISFQSSCAPLLLIIGHCHVVMRYLITNCSVGYKII